ncbi:MAG: ABC transporter permease [Acidobacteriia bacterium]|nr:ABC transporter permease [Terriglobia bacterium]
MTGKLVLENLKNRPMRTLLSVLLIGVPVTLILTLVGLSHGMLEDAQHRARAVGADIFVRPPGSSFLTASGAMPDGILGALEKLPHVKLAVGVVNQPVQGVTLGIAGIDLKQFDIISGGFRLLAGTTFQGPDDVMIDEFYASEKGLKPGGRVSLLNHDWRVCGIFEGGKLAHIVAPISRVQQLTGNVGKISQAYVKLDNPANTASMVQHLKSDPMWSNYPVYSVQEFTALYSINNIPGLRQFVGVVIGIGVVIGFAVVCLSMYMAVLQRTREIGILKALGASNGFILRVIVAEALLMGVGGTVLGIIMSYGAWWLIRTLVPASIQMVIVHSWWPIALGITLAGTGFGALYPGISAARHDVIEALAYE